MAATFRLEIATPDRPLLDRNVTEAQIPASNGYLGILPQHAPLVAELGVGTLSYVHEGGKLDSLLVHEGWVEVGPQHVRVLAPRPRTSPTSISIARSPRSNARRSACRSTFKMWTSCARCVR